ncbi:Adenylate cyclase, class 3 [Cribrihabitans marinus]|uniref:Adenylate cyclase, class 3 n=1 Tax=Cribrihabitans marinus TaxID=1227549 RepID=A0A1H7E3A4_9RHOB|nr:tetratricopeptide repeat protein [Cribrihabitans marinus]GGH40396.1 guanylyl cyclase [Cribrihabitans marinus]SEK05045.1 Adenylate cyclase, class 3 [Cribrihabitans marinus]
MTESRATRRLAAVLAADIVGYSRHMGRDELATRSRFNALMDSVIRPAVARFGGRIVKLLGDGLLVEFASVVDAVDCATAWQHEVARSNAADTDVPQLVFRIGVNLGDVIVEGDDIHGDGVNVASRLESLADPGGIVLSRAARDQVRDKIDIPLDDLGEIEVKNIARPVRAFKIGHNREPAPVARRRWPLAAAAAVLLAVALVWLQPWIRLSEARAIAAMELPLPSKPSVAVMPFRNQAGEPGELAADVIARDVTDSLSLVSGLFVISSSSTFSYKESTATPQQVSRELGVRNIVQGTVRGTGGDFRVAVEIVDGVNGATIWREEFQQSGSDSFKLKEDISHSIARILAQNIARSSAPGRSTFSDEAYTLWYRASREIGKAPSKSGFSFAKALAESALAIDPEFGRALAVLAYIDTQNGYFGFVDDRQGAMRKGLEKARNAVRLAPDDWYVHEMLGFSLMNVRAYEDAVAAFDVAIGLAPSSDSTLIRSALPLLFLGRPDEAEARLLTAMRINPLYDWAPVNFLAMAYYEQGRFPEAVEKFDEAARLNPGFIGNMVWRAAAHAQVGNQETAERIAARLLEKAPGWTISSNFVQIRDPAMQALLDDGLRKAGLPE